MKIISVVNQKGGVGKTTSTVNIAAEVGLLGFKTLIVDIDPQGNATSGVGLEKRKLTSTVYEALLKLCNAQECIAETDFKNLKIMPSSISLAGAEIEMIELENRVGRLEDILAEVSNEFDYVFIDCPPSLGLLALNALVACNSVLIPTQCEFYALEGLTQLMNTLKTVKRAYNPAIKIEGVLLTMFDARLKLTTEVADEIKKYFPNQVFKTCIPRNVKLSEAPSYGQPVIYFEKNSKGAKAYHEVAVELTAKATSKKEV